MPGRPLAEGRTASRRVSLDIGVLTLAAFAVRAAMVRWPVSLNTDSDEYLRLAQSLVATGAYSADGVTPYTYRPPLYPAAIAAVSLLATPPERAVALVQCGLGALTVALTMLVARRFFDRRVALVAGCLLAVAPMTARYASLMLSETLFTWLLLLGVYAWAIGRPAVAGVAFGAATMARASLLPYVLLIGAAGWLPLPDRRTYRAIALVALLTISPWIVRNVVEAGRLTVAEAGWGTNLLLGTVDLRSGSNRWAQIDKELGDSATAVRGAETERVGRVQALARIRANPGRWLLIRGRQWRWLFVDSGDYLPLRANAVTFAQALRERRVETILLKGGFVAGNVALLVLAAWGLFLSRGRAAELGPLWSFPVFLAAAHIPMFVEPRYGLPAMPLLIVLAASAVVHWRGRSPRVESQPVAPTSPDHRSI